MDNGNGTATFSGTPSAAGTYTLLVRATNSVTPDTLQTFTLTVNHSLPILVAGAGAGGPPLVSVYDARTGALKTQFLAYDAGFLGGVRVAVADVNGDGVPDILTGAGPGAGPHVKVFDGKTYQVERRRTQVAMVQCRPEIDHVALAGAARVEALVGVRLQVHAEGPAPAIAAAPLLILLRSQGESGTMTRPHGASAMICFLILTAFATTVIAAPVPKPDGVKSERFSDRRIELLRDSRVQKELGLSAEQRITIIDHFEAVDEEYSANVHSLFPPSSPPGESPEESAKKQQVLLEYGKKRSAKSRDVLAEVIEIPQLARLMELERSYLGPFAFADTEVVAELKLTPAQVTAVAKAIEGFRKPYEEEFGPRVKPSSRSIWVVSRPTLDAILKALTPDQQARWKELLGKEPKIATTGIAAARHLIATVAEKAFPPAKDD